MRETFKDFIKYGGFSIVIHHDIYSKYLEESKDYLLKITYKNKFNNSEIDILKKIEFEENYNKYFPKVKNEIIILKDNINFFNFLKNNNILATYKNKELDIFGYFLENCGSFELFDIISDMNDYKENVFSNNYYIKLSMFVNQMIDAIKFLKNNSICHFDLKPENIVYNENCFYFGYRFKIIDFGFAEKYPFVHYLENIKGTEPFIPKNENIDTHSWFDIININDWKKNNNKYIHYVEYTNQKTKVLVYKTDILPRDVFLNNYFTF